MSINTDRQDIPDISLLQELANQFFKAAPGTVPYVANAGSVAPENAIPGHSPNITSIPIDASGVAPSYGEPFLNAIDLGTVHQQGTAANLKNPQTALPAPHFTGTDIAQSVTGSDISPFSHQQLEIPSLLNGKPIASEPAIGTGKLPQSLAGSGISPSAHRQYNEVDLKNPQTALHDPHFATMDKTPFSTGGNGIPLSAIYTDTVPFASEHELLPTGSLNGKDRNALPVFVPQIPYTSGEAAYYFLKEDNRGRNKNKVSTVALNNTSGLLSEFIEPPFDVDLIKKDFPILQERINGRPLIWLDNAATTQKPRQVIERINYFYEHENSNIHRAAHDLAARATDAYEAAREKVRSFLNAASSNEIIFVRGTTEGINLVAKSYGEQFLRPGDEIIISHLEHHANIVPWQQLVQKKGVKLRVIPVDDDGQVLLDEYQKLLNPKTKLVSFTQVSNSLGTVTPAKQIIDLAHNAGAKVLLDGAQSVSHIGVDLQYLNPDFFVFSGHKIFGPTGIGAVYGKEALLNEIQPWQGGGNMIKDVTFERTVFHDAPSRFEAGTGNIADAVGLGAALDYVNRLGIDNINRYEHYLLSYATKLMKEVPGLRLIGTAADKASVLSFTLKGFSNDEVGKELNKEGIAVRTGHHCSQPILRRFGLESTVRPSLAFYNTCADVDTLVSVLHRLQRRT